MSLGWFELQLLIIISQREKYGYEILNDLKNSGKIKYSTGSLYPTLKRLKKKGYVSTRIYKKEDSPDRVYYSITEEGKHILEDIMKYILTLIDRNMWDEILELREIVISKANIHEGDFVMDFSKVVGELFAMDLSKKVGNSGKVYLTVDNTNQVENFKDYFQKINVHNIKLIFEQIPINIIRTSSINSAIQIVGLHHYVEPLKVIEEMKRIILPGSKIVISDMQKIDHVIFNNICKMFLPEYYRVGTSIDELHEYFSSAGLENIEVSEWHGMVIGEGTKPSLKFLS